MTKGSSGGTTTTTSNSVQVEVPTHQEMAWALAIREAAARDPRIHHEAVSDFMFLQHAIVAKDNVPKAIKRIRTLQNLRETYSIKIEDSFEEALRDMQIFLQSYPGFLLSIAPRTNESFLMCANYNLCASYKHLRSVHVNPNEGFAVLLRGFIAMMQACQPDVVAVRQGLHFVGNGYGMCWKDFSWQVEEGVFTLYSSAYPIRIHRIVMLNSNFWIRRFYNFIKALTNKKVWGRHHLVGDAQEFLLQSSKEYSSHTLPKDWGGQITDEALQQALADGLRRHYECVANFRLQGLPEGTTDDSQSDQGTG